VLFVLSRWLPSFFILQIEGNSFNCAWLLSLRHISSHAVNTIWTCLCFTINAVWLFATNTIPSLSSVKFYCRRARQHTTTASVAIEVKDTGTSQNVPTVRPSCKAVKDAPSHNVLTIRPLSEKHEYAYIREEEGKAALYNYFFFVLFKWISKNTFNKVCLIIRLRNISCVVQYACSLKCNTIDSGLHLFKRILVLHLKMVLPTQSYTLSKEHV